MLRILRAAPSVVFAALSQPSELAKWFGPQGFTIASLEFEPRRRRDLPDQDAATGE